jgi:hypothetical protein
VNENKAPFPIDRLSIVLAFITLSMGLIYFLPPASNAPVGSIVGFIVNIQLDAYTLLIGVIALLALSSTLWVLQAHAPAGAADHNPLQLLPQGILPVLSVFVFSLALREMARNNVWWVVYVLGAILLGIILVAELSVQEIGSEQHPFAAIGLIGLSHALFLILAVVLKTLSTRLYITLPLIFLASGFTALRTLYLRLRGLWKAEYAIAIAILVSQLAVGLNYLFLTPIQYGLLLIGALYILISLASSFIQQASKRDLLLEPALMLGLTLVIAFLVG